jgi:hypothetical protein
MKDMFQRTEEDISATSIDTKLEIFCLALLTPMFGLIWMPADIFDVLTYLSFAMTVWSAMFAGRGVFAGQDGSRASKKVADIVAKQCYLFGGFFLVAAALLLAPTMFRKTEGVITFFGNMGVAMFAVTLVTVSALKYLQSGKYFWVRALIVPACSSSLLTSLALLQIHFA